MGKTNTKTKSKHDRGWELVKQKTRTCNKSFAEKIEQTRKKEINITSKFINDSLNCQPRFLGCFAEDELESFSITSFPCYLIVNIDSVNMKGSHWIALGLFTDKIEIFDSLGFNIFNWSRVPSTLLNFLHNFSVSREVIISPPIQTEDSVLCGFYCIYYVITRVSKSFNELSSRFDFKRRYKNDNILYNFFK